MFYRIKLKVSRFAWLRGIHFRLKNPEPGRKYTFEEVWPKGFLLSGSVAARFGKRYSLWLKSEKSNEEIVCTRTWADSEKRRTGIKLLDEGVNLSFHQRIRLGRKNAIILKFESGEISLGKIEVIPLMVALTGQDNWLFLDNDSNRSVDQYCGQFLLTEDKLQQWEDYLNDLTEISEGSLPMKTGLIIVPAKELVIPEYYPYPRGKLDPYKQILELLRGRNYHLPIEDLLKNHSKRTFRKTDTHWNSEGARLVSLQIAKWFQVGIPENIFSTDKYKTVPQIGDLGIRFYPPLMAEEEELESYSYGEDVVFDNRISNVGRLIVINRNSGSGKGILLLFGGSSAMFLLDFLSRLFSTIVFAHGVGNVDRRIIDAVKPDYLIIQTNSRFLVEVPSTRTDLGDRWKSKVSGDEKAILLKQLKEQTSRAPDVPFLKALLNYHEEVLA